MYRNYLCVVVMNLQLLGQTLRVSIEIILPIEI